MGNSQESPSHLALLDYPVDGYPIWNAGIHGSTGTFLLWIKSLGRYSASRVNQLGTIAPALGIFYTLAVCFASDLLIGPAWAITVASVWNAIGLVIPGDLERT